MTRFLDPDRMGKQWFFLKIWKDTVGRRQQALSPPRPWIELVAVARYQAGWPWAEPLRSRWRCQISTKPIGRGLSKPESRSSVCRRTHRFSSAGGHSATRENNLHPLQTGEKKKNRPFSSPDSDFFSRKTHRFRVSVRMPRRFHYL